MKSEKRGQAGAIAALLALFGSLIFVSAALTNSSNETLINLPAENLALLNETAIVNNETNNSIENQTSENTPLNDSIITNETLNLTIPEENLTPIEQVNLTFPVESVLPPNQLEIANETINLTIPIVGIPYVNETLSNQTNIPLINQSNNLSDGLIANLSNFTIMNSSAIIIENLSTNNISKLAKLFDEDILEFDREYRLKYLQGNNNFSNISYKRIAQKENLIFNVGAKRDNIHGVSINSKNFAIDLIDCDSWERYCAFRINGVPTKKIFSFDEFGNNRKNSFDLDENFTMKINSVKFDFCDNRRFCHLGYEGYHVVDISFEEKNGR